MSPFDQELVEFYRQRMIQQAQSARLSKQVLSPRFELHQRVLFSTGDILISLGLKLKNLSTPTEDHTYTPLYT